MTKRYPTPPPELYGLWLDDGGPDGAGCWVQHTNGPRSGPMVFTTMLDARVAAKYEAPLLGTDCEHLVTIRPMLIGVAPHLP